MMATRARPTTPTGRLTGLAAEEKEAWSEYLLATSGLPDVRYEELEPWAWARLGRRLAAIQARREAIRNEDQP